MLSAAAEGFPVALGPPAEQGRLTSGLRGWGDLAEEAAFPGPLLAGARLEAELSGGEGVREARMELGLPILGSVHYQYVPPAA